MEINQLQIFITVASMQNFTQAGRILGYSQSNISAQIQKLEQEIGAPLFNRIGRSISLTPHGEQLLPYAQQIVSTSKCIENLLKNDGEITGTLHIGMTESLFDLLFEHTVNEYHKRFPLINIDITVDSTENLKRQLQRGLLDFACIIDQQLPQAEWNCYHTTPASIVIVSGKANPLFNAEKLRLADLVNEEFILMEEDAPYIVSFMNEAAAKSVKLNTFLYLQSSSMARKLVEKVSFLSVLPQYSVESAVEKGKVKILPVEDFCETQYIQLALHPNKILTPHVSSFLDLLVEKL